MDIEPINKMSAGFQEETGLNVLNGFMLDVSEASHCARLLELMNTKRGAVVLDAGCGFGAVAKHMADARPDLRFRLLNLSEIQLETCPPGMTKLHGSFDAIPLEDASVDVVMFNYAICHSHDWLVTLKEARRVLREGGTLFIFDMARVDCIGNGLMNEALQASAYPQWQVTDVAKRAGFDLMEAVIHEPAENRLQGLMGFAAYALVVGEVVPATWRFTRQTISDPIKSAFARHSRIGFQFSGGRDSTAALYLLREYWGRMEVYHLDTGDQFPETREVVNQVEGEFKAATGRAFTSITTSVDETRRVHGLASDLVPVDNTAVGRLISGRELKIISRYDCCYLTLMEPIHRQIQHDGISLLIRGQRDDEYVKQPRRSGDVDNGIELLYPIQEWTGEQVSAYLKDNGHPVAPFYDRGARRAPECMGCTAWWDEGRGAYMREYHPIKFEQYKSNMQAIRAEIDRQYAMLDDKE